MGEGVNDQLTNAELAEESTTPWEAEVIRRLVAIEDQLAELLPLLEKTAEVGEVFTQMGAMMGNAQASGINMLGASVVPVPSN